MGVARLTKVTVIAPRSEHAEVAKALARFKDFHPIESSSPNFDPKVQELTVKAVRLFSQVDQAVKDLGLKTDPGWMDQVFRGVKIERTSFEAGEWDELLTRVDRELEPLVGQVRTQKDALLKASKEEADSQTMMDALQAVSAFSADLAGLSDLHRLKAMLFVAGKQAVQELKNSLPEGLFVSQPVGEELEIVLAVVRSASAVALERAAKTLEIKPLVIPPAFPQNPSEAYKRLAQERDAATARKAQVEAELSSMGTASGSRLLAMRELTESARDMLDEARVSGEMKRMATVAGYIPSKDEARFKETFASWMTYFEPMDPRKEDLPVLFENRKGFGLWQLITREQGIPGGDEVDPTPLVSFVFPVFFGLMFGDFGHGLVLTLFVLFVRQRVTGTKRQWANIFLIAGISSMVFGAIFGEFFGLSLYSSIPIPPIASYLNVDVINRGVSPPAPDISTFMRLMVVSMIIGILHLATALGLNVYEGVRSGEMTEVYVEKLPAFTMYISGVMYGISFIVGGFSFNVLESTAVVPGLGIQANELGALGLAILIPSMLVLFLGKAVAVRLGKTEGESFGSALADGGLEVFERILQFLSNTISYVRLAVMLLVHAVLLVIVYGFFPLTNPALIPAWIVFNLMVLALEGLIVYVQDLRLHVYEFFTKFYAGNGEPFRRILPDRPRIRIDWS